MYNHFRRSLFTRTAQALFISLIGLFSCTPEVITPEMLFQENFHPFPNVLFDLEQDSLSPNPSVLTFLAYRKKNYQEALDYSEKISPLSPTDPIQLYRGVCLMALGKIKDAESILTLLSQEESDYKDAANWYIALCKLKQKNLSAAKINLQKLTNRSTYIRNEAQVLLKKVENITVD